MDFNHKIKKVNKLLDKIEDKLKDYKTYEEIPEESLVYAVRGYDIAFDMVIDLIKKGAW